MIKRLKGAPVHMLLVFDEYGHFEGIVTSMGILGAIAGGFDETEEDAPKVAERADGSRPVAGWMPVDEFADRTGISLENDAVFETVTGLVLNRAAEPPQVGQSVVIDGWVLEVVDMVGRRIDKLLVHRVSRNG